MSESEQEAEDLGLLTHMHCIVCGASNKPTYSAIDYDELQQYVIDCKKCGHEYEIKLTRYGKNWL